ncbi:AMP-binding protein [Rhodococcus ruber]|uniref:class I adenylate-forming enzyme family protein n=1 Tax=Rhodococcus TaxID=1827 RepID=UPI000E6B2B8B|nr:MULTISPECIES: AMP-binding protein [Rhodococcus]AXY54708.1 acyl-CoA synthetase [Rhodococcus ruber]UQB72721.1 AMP-binding protein [Rhodococcus ruber]WML62608.1 AMP-binding protein [Rhodococcus sp. AH-ZY2]
MTSQMRPWTALYPNGLDPEPVVPFVSLVDAWRARVDADPDGKAIAYFDGVLTARETDELSDALAVAFAARGVRRGDRVGIYLQNIPQYALTLLALWKLGAAALVLNPMYRRAELRRLVDDAEIVGMVCADTAVAETADTVRDSSVRWIVSTSDLDFQSRDDARVFPTTDRAVAAPDGDLVELIEQHRGRRPSPVEITGDDVALLAYTSGTTGPPKGAMNTHANVLAVATTFGSFVGLTAGDAVFAVAPLFHITGAVINATLALVHRTTLVFANRFNAEVALEALVEHGVTFTIGSITVFNALYETPGADARHFASVKTLYSGGAPIPPATVEKFEAKFGKYIHNAYGMTETSSGVIAVPPGRRAPVDPASGTLAIDVPLPLIDARVVDADGAVVEPGTQGELELAGPQVISGYWRKPEASASTLPGGRLRTGDGAIIDRHGWVYLVDRLKDQINVSGYKVWPREVEDALYEHPAVHEAAVVGQPDDYQGESVVAYVSLERDAHATERELVDFVRDRLAAYKRPRRVHIVENLPKTQTGKIRRSDLRDRTAPTATT